MATKQVALAADTWVKLSTGTTPVTVQIREEARALVRSIDDSDIITNGDFAADSDWTKGTGWTIAAGVATCSGAQAGDSDLTQIGATLSIPLVNGNLYEIIFTVSGYVAGNVTPVVGETEGTDRSADGTFTEQIVAGAGADIDIRGDVDFNGNIDNVSVTRVPNDDIGFFIDGRPRQHAEVEYKPEFAWASAPSLSIWAKSLGRASVVTVEET